MTTVLKGNDLAVFLLKGDECRDWNCQSVEVLEQVIHDSVLLPHLIEFLVGDELATGSKGFDQIWIVEGEDDVCDLDPIDLRSCLLGLLLLAFGS